MKSENILEIKNLSVSFPLRKGIFFSGNREVKAVEDFTLNIKRGETIGLVGESGCGKSTVVKAVSNLIKFSAPEAKVKGEINFYKDGNEFQLLGMKDSELKKLRKHIQVVFQDPYSSLNPRMTIGKAIEEPISNFEKISKEEKRERVNNLLDKTGLRKDLFYQALSILISILRALWLLLGHSLLLLLSMEQLELFQILMKLQMFLVWTE